MDTYQQQCNKRQFGWMAYFIEQYLKGTLSIGRLVNNLEGLVNFLTDVDVEWKKRFDLAHSTLVSTFEASITRTPPELDKEEISNAISELTVLIQEKLEKEAISDIGDV